MTIRFTCDKCGSVLKIKDALAGTDGKCPKCKTRFIVPEPDLNDPSDSSPALSVPEEVPTETPSTASAYSSAGVNGSRTDSPTPPPLKKSRPAATPTAEKPVSEKPHSAKPAAEKPTTDAPEKTVAKAIEKSTSKPTLKPAESKPAAAVKPAKKDEDEFDPVSFLMEGPAQKPTFTPDPEPDARSSRPSSLPPRQGGGGFSLDDDPSDFDGDVETPPPTRKWGAKKDSSPPPIESPSGASHNAAKDLLDRTKETSRIRAGEMPEKPVRESFDFAGFIRGDGAKAVGGGIVALLVAFRIYVAMVGSLGNNLDIPELGQVSGYVTIKGQPVEGIRVYYTPLDSSVSSDQKKKSNKQRARDSIGVTDAEGKFTLRYDPDHPGAKVGPCRVWMEAPNPTVVIPKKFSLGSDQKVDVKKGANEPTTYEL